MWDDIAVNRFEWEQERQHNEKQEMDGSYARRRKRMLDKKNSILLRHLDMYKQYRFLKPIALKYPSLVATHMHQTYGTDREMYIRPSWEKELIRLQKTNDVSMELNPNFFIAQEKAAGFSYEDFVKETV